MKQLAARVPFGGVLYIAIVAVVGIVIICAGIAMFVLPGPGILTILLGLGLLGTEFPWAHRLLLRIKAWAQPFIDHAVSWWRILRKSGRSDSIPMTENASRYEALAERAERGELESKPGTIRRREDARSDAQHALMQATGANTVPDAMRIAVGHADF